MGRSRDDNRASEPGMVEAWDSRIRPERAPERLAEERRPARQVGSGGWFPRNEQPRDARHGRIPIARKKGGTAGADASRPFGPDAAHVAPAGAGRPVDVRNRRGFIMFEASAASDPRLVPHPTPGLTRVEPQSDPFTEAIAPRAISLGGSGAGNLPTFTISARLQGRSVLTDTDLTRDEIVEVLETAGRLKKLRQAGQPHGYLAGKSLGMIFQHPSTRTRVAFEAGMAQLGGQAIFLGVHDLQIKRGESLADTAQVLSRYVDGIVARVAAHSDIEEIAAASAVPVLNGLSDRWHPMQALSDLLTLQEVLGGLAGRKLAYLGDGNNMIHSLLLACSAMGMSVSVASPRGYQPDPEVVNHARWLAATSGANPEIEVTDDPMAAASNADAIYTDVHVSMGQTDAATRAVALAPYKVTAGIMDAAKPAAVFMHCLPMHRDQEVEAAVADGPRSIIFDQAENRLHLQKAVLLHTLCSIVA
jgi:ornithine carbamoyltransferase